MELYDSAILLQFPGLGPTNHYIWNELAGSTVIDYGIPALNVTTNGTVTRGYDTGLPGDPTGRSTRQSKDTVMATRGDNALMDRPATTNKLSLLTWFRPDDLRVPSSAGQY